MFAQIVFTCIPFFCFLYLYRWRVLSYVLRCAIPCVKLYVRTVLWWNTQENGLKRMSSIDCGACRIDQCVVVTNDKEYSFNAVHVAGYQQIVSYDQVIQLLDDRSRFVHTNLSRMDDVIVVDLTNDLKDFFLYFRDKQSEMGKLKYFFEFVTEKYSINIDDLFFVVFRNDDTFSELRRCVRDAMNMTYSDLVDCVTL
jgi:hypothetical protein